MFTVNDPCISTALSPSKCLCPHKHFDACTLSQGRPLKYLVAREDKTSAETIDFVTYSMDFNRFSFLNGSSPVLQLSANNPLFAITISADYS